MFDGWKKITENNEYANLRNEYSRTKMSRDGQFVCNIQDDLLGRLVSDILSII